MSFEALQDAITSSDVISIAIRLHCHDKLAMSIH